MLRELVLCGVDGSDASLSAVEVAASLEPRELHLVAVADRWAPPATAGDGRGGSPLERAQAALDAARHIVDDRCQVIGRVLEGDPKHVLAGEAERLRVGLIVVGSHGLGRLAGAVTGSVATTLTHLSRRSVLVVRGDLGRAGGVPDRIVVGVDGSPGSLEALDAATEVHAGRAIPLEVVCADGAETLPGFPWGVDPAAVRLAAGPAMLALIEAVGPADLLVVGSRGHHGVRAVGSVAERVVHLSSSSVLVVRESGGVDGGTRLRPTVAEAMSSPALRVPADATLLEATGALCDAGADAAVVVDGRGRLRGLLTTSDYAGYEVRFSRTEPSSKMIRVFGHWLATNDIDAVYRVVGGVRVRDVASPAPMTTVPDEMLDEVVERMVQRGIEHVPVLRDGEVVGMLSYRNLLAVALRAMRSGAPEVD